VLALYLSLLASSAVDPLIHDVRELSPDDAAVPFAQVPQPTLLGDRFEYADQDRTGGFLVWLPGAPKNGASPVEFALAITSDKGEKIAEARFQPKQLALASFVVDVGRLPVGHYQITATRAAPMQASAKMEIVRSKHARIEPKAEPFPRDGVPLVLDSVGPSFTGSWPVRGGIPLPIGALEGSEALALLENGKRIPADFTTRATWCPGCGPKWVHVDFVARYERGAPARYTVERTSKPQGGRAQLEIAESADRITIDTGALRFDVGKKSFAGIEHAVFGGKPVIEQGGGPYLVDDRGIRFSAAKDAHVSVTVEERGPTRATILATGWYASEEGRVEPLCIFRTRIIAFAGESMVRIRHQTLITYDTRTRRLADVGFDLPLPKDTGRAIARFGGDGAALAADLQPASAPAWLHQDRADHFRASGIGPKEKEGRRSDGWASFESATLDPAVAVFDREMWQQFPKELEVGPHAITVHSWPRHGHRAFRMEEELDLRNLYKFWCFHQHELLDLSLPNDYYAALKAAPPEETFECRPEWALEGNGQGLAIDEDFAVVALPKSQRDRVPSLAAVFAQDPSPRAPPAWNAASEAMGHIAAPSAKFGDVETAMNEGFLSFTRSIERGGDYGRWNYGDLHTYWKIKEERPSLHRVWHSSHYHEGSAAWSMYFRTGSQAMLRFARAMARHLMNVDLVNYADASARLKFHVEGAPYHCKGILHWGTEAFGMSRGETHAAVFAHFVDPDAYLYDWYLDGDPRAKDAYDLWSRAVRKQQAPLYGVRREANTSLAYAITYYQHTWDASILPAIHGLGLSLRTREPLEKQGPGPMWHPHWINRYFEQTRDPEYVPFIEKYGRWVDLGGTWVLGLSALAYQLTHDATYLEAHLPDLADFPRRFYREAGDPYDWYGVGPGPLGSKWAYDGWGYFLAALLDANISAIDRPPRDPQLPLAPSRLHAYDPPGLVVLALEREDRPLAIDVQAHSLGADRHPFTLRLLSPSGRVLAERDVKGGPLPYEEKIAVAADGERGLDRIEVRASQLALHSPLTNLENEAVLLPKSTVSVTQRLAMYAVPIGSRAPVSITIASLSDDLPAGYKVRDRSGKTVREGSLLRTRRNASVTVELDPLRVPPPWKIDVVGVAGISWIGSGEGLLLAPSNDSLEQIGKLVGPKPATN
jgi:hypothetical protein